MILVSPEHLNKSHFSLHKSKAPINWKWMKYIHVVLHIIKVTMTDKIDAWFLNMTPSNAISRSVPKGHVSHLNDLVPVSRGKPFWVKPAINRIAKTSLSRNWSFSQECEPTTGTPTSKGPSKKQGRDANSKQPLALQCPEKENHHTRDPQSSKSASPPVMK